jgi:hypothetical protein
MLVGLDVWLNKLRRHELDCVALALQLPSPVMSPATCFHADKTRRQVSEDDRHLLAFNRSELSTGVGEVQSNVV